MSAKKYFVAVVVIAFFMPINGGICAQEKGAESMVLDGGSMGSVQFPHGRHQEISVDCQPCHGVFAKEPHIIDTMKSAGELPKKNVMAMCSKCHKDLAARGEKTGPTGCKDCHKK